MRKTPRIMLFLDASRGFSRGMLSGIARYSSLNGPWTFFQKPPVYLNSNLTLNIQELKKWKPDGIICSISQANELKYLNVPIIGYDPVNYSGVIPCVVSEHTMTGEMAAEHLLELAHRSYAFCGFNSLDWSNERCDAFCKVINKAGMEVNVYDNNNMSWSNEEYFIKEWLALLPKPIGIFCVNDDRAASIAGVCRLLGYGVPEDVSIIGADDDEYICELENPPLSSVQMASKQGGYNAAHLLHQIIQGKEKMNGQRVIVKATGITSRQSTNALMVQNKEVRKALRFIRENHNQNIQVRDVVKSTSLSHRTLNDLFHAELGKSIIKQLNKVRINYISRLLIDTEMKVQEISLFVGYKDDRHFSRYFKRATGLTPQAYRRDNLPP